MPSQLANALVRDLEHLANVAHRKTELGQFLDRPPRLGGNISLFGGELATRRNRIVDREPDIWGQDRLDADLERVRQYVQEQAYGVAGHGLDLVQPLGLTEDSL
jgi:hypothetical protein